jgi:hypothetical protein
MLLSLFLAFRNRRHFRTARESINAASLLPHWPATFAIAPPCAAGLPSGNDKT